MICSTCKGSGRDPMSDYIDWSKCTTCHGSGQMTREMAEHLDWLRKGSWPPIRDKSLCPSCGAEVGLAPGTWMGGGGLHAGKYCSFVGATVEIAFESGDSN